MEMSVELVTTFAIKDLTHIQDTDGEDSTFGEGYLKLRIRAEHLLMDLICSTESYTTSLASSITAYQHKHGRRYHAYQSGRKCCSIHMF